MERQGAVPNRLAQVKVRSAVKSDPLVRVQVLNPRKMKPLTVEKTASLPLSVRIASK